MGLKDVISIIEELNKDNASNSRLHKNAIEAIDLLKKIYFLTDEFMMYPEPVKMEELVSIIIGDKNIV